MTDNGERKRKMDESYKVINIHFIRPGIKNEKQRCEILYCNACERCELYKKNQCLNSRGFFGGLNVHCPHSRCVVEKGYTPKAKSYASWFAGKAKQYGDDLVDKLATQNTKLAIVGGDYVYLPYKHLKNFVNQIEGIIAEHFLKLEDFTTEKICEIVTFIPRASFDYAEIKTYQEKEVPRFIWHLKERFPDMYERFLSEYPQYREIFEEKEADYVGRTAKVATLRQGSVIKDCHSNKWMVTGNQIVCDRCDTSLMIPFGKDPVRIVMDITDDMTVKITNNSMVDENTIFVD